MSTQIPIQPVAERPQALRWRRFRLASAIYAVCIPLVLVAQAIELVAPRAAAGAIAAIVVVNVALFALFRLGINERFRDPSLTREQVVAAIVVVLVFAYAMDRERSLVLVMCPVVLMFGVFRLSTRDFLSVALVVIAGYAFVVVLLVQAKPQTVELRVELFRMLLIACVLPCFAVVAGKVSDLRRNLRRSNADLAAALGTIQAMATRDALTGLPNRAIFNESLQRAVSAAGRSGRPIALFFVDLDKFKRINDALGHQVGDEVLREAARRLASCVRESDLAARFGGDEFVLLVDGYADTSMLAEIASRVLEAMHRPMQAGQQTLDLSACIGISTCPGDAADAKMLLAHADIAMYRAKEQGRNRYRFYTPGIDAAPAAQSPANGSLAVG